MLFQRSKQTNFAARPSNRNHCYFVEDPWPVAVVTVVFFCNARSYFNFYYYIGLRVEDVYCNKFHKEPYVMNHIYAQYFHPETLLERVRDVAFYRRPRTIFKGFRVPDWAQSQKMHGWDVDAYSRQAW